MSHHGIKFISLQTGLSPHVIRVWEKRYEAVTPLRTDTNRRLYTDEQLERLVQLAELTKQGHAISHIASLPNHELCQLCENGTAPPTTAEPDQPVTAQLALNAITRMDQGELEQILDEAVKRLGYSGLLEKVLIPLIGMVGEAWHNGSLTTAEEHAATSFIKDYLCVSARSFSHEAHAPILLATTPAGQLHELGAIIAASQARKLGWQVIYLGPSLPADEIAGAAEKVSASAIMLSIVYPADDLQIPVQLQRLRKQLDATTPIIVGGCAAQNYATTLKQIDAIRLSSMTELTSTLETIRSGNQRQAL